MKDLILFVLVFADLGAIAMAFHRVLSAERNLPVR